MLKSIDLESKVIFYKELDKEVFIKVVVKKVV